MMELAVSPSSLKLQDANGINIHIIRTDSDLDTMLKERLDSNLSKSVIISPSSREQDFIELEDCFDRLTVENDEDIGQELGEHGGGGKRPAGVQPTGSSGKQEDVAEPKRPRPPPTSPLFYQTNNRVSHFTTGPISDLQTDCDGAVEYTGEDWNKIAEIEKYLMPFNEPPPHFRVSGPPEKPVKITSDNTMTVTITKPGNIPNKSSSRSRPPYGSSEIIAGPFSPSFQLRVESARVQAEYGPPIVDQMSPFSNLSDSRSNSDSSICSSGSEKACLAVNTPAHDCHVKVVNHPSTTSGGLVTFIQDKFPAVSFPCGRLSCLGNTDLDIPLNGTHVAVGPASPNIVPSPGGYSFPPTPVSPDDNCQTSHPSSPDNFSTSQTCDAQHMTYLPGFESFLLTKLCSPENFLNHQLVNSLTSPDDVMQKSVRLSVADTVEDSVEFSQEGLLPLEILNAVVSEDGTWLEDEYGDTFLHSISAWENETAAIANLHLVKQKPGFDKAINKMNHSLETPLYSAVYLGKVKLVEALLKLGANVNTLCRYMTLAHTPLHQAVEQGQTDMVAVLLDCPYTDINAERVSDRCTPLMLALMVHRERDCFETIQKLVKANERPNFQAVDQRSGKTALMLAVETKDIRVVELILTEVGVDDARQLVNMTNRAGNSAVHIAAGLREDAAKEQILRKLIMSGGDTNKKNIEGDTPKDWARIIIDKVAKMR